MTPKHPKAFILFSGLFLGALSGILVMKLDATPQKISDLQLAQEIRLDLHNALSYGEPNYFVDHPETPDPVLSEDVFIGKNAGVNAHTVSGSTISGSCAAQTLITGSDNLVLGEGADVPSPNTSHFLNLNSMFCAYMKEGKLHEVICPIRIHKC